MSGTGGHGRGTPAVFLDRDGVIIENRGDYVKAWDEVEFLPGACAALQHLAPSPYKVVMVTNQSAIGRGILSFEQAVAINRRIVTCIEAQGGRIDACYICPHHPNDGCTCRKPLPGLLLQAQADLDLDLSRSWLIGDAVTDMEAARAAGAQGILVLTGRGQEQISLLPSDAPCTVVPDLASGVAHIL